MKHLANFIKMVPLAYYNSFDDTNIDADIDVLTLLSTSDVILNEDPKQNNAGIKYQQTFSVVSEKLSDTIRAYYPPNIPVVALIYTDDSTPYLLGDSEYKLRVIITPHTDYDELTFTRETITPLF